MAFKGTPTSVLWGFVAYAGLFVSIFLIGKVVEFTKRQYTRFTTDRHPSADLPTAADPPATVAGATKKQQ